MKTKNEALEILSLLLREQTPTVPILACHESFLQRWSQEHGVAGFLYNFKNLFSQNFTEFLNHNYKTNVQRNILFLEEFKKLASLAREDGLPAPVALKGLALLNRVHALGERSLTDMDILIPAGALSAYDRVLTNFGYIAVAEIKWRANQHKSVYHKSFLGLDMTVELHTKLFYNQPDDFMPGTITFEDRLILEPNLEAVYLSAHLVHQHTFLKLFWLIDLYRLSRKSPVFQSKLCWTLAHRLRVKKSFSLVALCLSKLFGEEVARAPLPLMNRLFSWNTLIQLSETRFKYLCIKHATKDSWGETITYNLRWLYFRVVTFLLKVNKNKASVR